MRHFCTYFDSRYLLRGLTLFRSMQAHAGEFVLWALCCDQASFEALQTLDIPNLRPVELGAIEAFEPRLDEAKTNRSRIEYLWTLSPIWPLFLLETRPEIESITYLDADQFFFSSPAPVFEEIGESSVALFSHRFAERDRWIEIYGIYNVGWLSFRRDASGLACLRQWREQCLQWCYDRLEGEKHGDQKYLDAWPQQFDGVRVVEHRGSGIAPWNCRNYLLTRRGGTVCCDGVPLVFFHFHGLKFFNSWLCDPVYSENFRPSTQAKRHILRPYLRALIQTAQWARAAGCRIEFGHTPLKSYLSASGPRFVLSKVMRRRLVVHRGLK